MTYQGPGATLKANPIGQVIFSFLGEKDLLEVQDLPKGTLRMQVLFFQQHPLWFFRASMLNPGAAS